MSDLAIQAAEQGAEQAASTDSQSAQSSSLLSDSVWSRMLDPQAHLNMWKRCLNGTGSMGDYAGCTAEAALGLAVGLEFAATTSAIGAGTIVASEIVAMSGATFKGIESYVKHGK